MILDRHDGGDPTVRPQDDLFRFANGTWLDETSIATDRTEAGTFIDLRDTAEKAVHEIVTSLDPQDDGTAGKIARLYQCFMNEGHIDTLDAAPLHELLTELDSVRTVTEFASWLGKSEREGLRSLWGVYDDADPSNPDQYVAYLSQSGLGLPDEAYYRLDEHKDVRGKYEEHITRSFELVDFPEPAREAQRVVEVETAIASHHWDRTLTRDMVKSYNPMPWEEFIQQAPEIWEAWRLGARIPAEAVKVVVVRQPSYFEAITRLLQTADVEDLKAWAKFALTSSLSHHLSNRFAEEKFDFYSRILRGVEMQRPRWKRGLSVVEDALGEEIGRYYVEQYFPAESKQQMLELVDNLLEAYRRSISQLDWLGDDTRAEALKKLSKFTPKIGYPDRWRDYSGLEIDLHDLVGNVRRASEFEFDFHMSRIGKPLDNDEWFMFPQTVNAYYHPFRNEIVFPAAILQPPFFDPNASAAQNYGAIGSVIGHEIGHGFDDQGSTCDGDGRLHDWWTDEDRSAFDTRTSALVDQYEGQIPVQLREADIPTGVNGRLTIGENIGDIGGLGIAYKAWANVSAGSRGDTTESSNSDTPAGSGSSSGVDAAQAREFFIAYARVWRSKVRNQALVERLATDPHSPAEFRCNLVARNIDGFHQAFETTSQDELWLEPEERVSIW